MRVVHVLAPRFMHGVVCALVFTGAAVSAQSPTAVARMSFFVTSVGLGSGGNLGGLKGADAHCQKLARSVGAGDRQWRAYLSARDVGRKRVDARDRIGNGPWFNSKLLQVAASLDDLHSARNRIAFLNALNEKGEVVARERHDILTGSNPDGTLATNAPDTTCHDWTSNTSGRAMVGHHDKVGGPNSWNSAHLTQGCDVVSLRSSQGAGLLYCFAAK